MTNEIINFGGKCFSVLSVSGISTAALNSPAVKPFALSFSRALVSFRSVSVTSLHWTKL